MVEKHIEPSLGSSASGDADARPMPAVLGPGEELPLLRAAWDALPDAVLLVRAATGQVVLANSAACRLLEYSSEELRGVPWPAIAPDWPNLGERSGIGDRGLEGDEPSQTPDTQPLIPNPQSPISYSGAATRVAFRTRAGVAVDVECWLRPVATPADGYLVLIARPAGEQDGVCDGRSATGGDRRRPCPSNPQSPIPNSLSSAARHTPSVARHSPSDDRDALTGLPDRRHFEGRLMVALRKARSRAEYHFAVLFVDLDGFKALNDTWGHLHGDRVLQDIAGRLYACIRPQDTIARFGGDEFTVLVDNLHNPSDVIHVAERIQSQMRVPVDVEGHRATITASIGIALSWHGYRDPEAMLGDADRAMYRAKAEGKARYYIWTPPGERMKDEG